MSTGERAVRGAWDYGPTARAVARNVAEHREANGMTLRTLSEQMGKLGRPVTVDGLSKVERCARRVDVDDLMALAVALKTTPLDLLLPAEDGYEGATGVPEDVTRTEFVEWSRGRWPLDREGRLARWRSKLAGARQLLAALEANVAKQRQRNSEYAALIATGDGTTQDLEEGHRQLEQAVSVLHQSREQLAEAEQRVAELSGDGG